MSHTGFPGPFDVTGCIDPSGPSSLPDLSTGPGLGQRSARSSFTSLRGLSDGELLARVKGLVSRERAVTLGDPRPSYRSRAPETAPRSRVRLDVRLLHPAPRVFELGGEPADPGRPMRPGLPGGLRAPGKERGEPGHDLSGGVDSHGDEREGCDRKDPGEVPARGRGDRGDLPPAGLDAGPCEAGVRGGPGTERSPTQFDKR